MKIVKIIKNNEDFSMWCNYKITKIPAWSLDFLGTKQEKIEYLKNNKVDWVKIWEGHNVVPKAIRSSIAQLISWTTILPTLKANIVALWSDDTLANENNTQLWAEFKRSLFDNRYSVENTAFLDVYFTKAEIWVATLLEVWVFIDWLVWTPNSWYLLSRINVDEQFTWNEELSINCSFTILW